MHGKRRGTKMNECIAWIEAPQNCGLLYFCYCPKCGEQEVIGMARSEPYHCQKCGCEFRLVGSKEQAGKTYDKELGEVHNG